MPTLSEPPPPAVNPSCGLLQPPMQFPYYAFCSPPKTAGSEKLTLTNNMRKTRGAHSYHCMMWEPRIYRGSTATKKTYEICAKKATYKRQTRQTKTRPSRSPSASNKGNNVPHPQQSKHNQRVQKHNSNLDPKGGQHHALNVKAEFQDVEVQTDAYLEDYTEEIAEKETSTQTDLHYDREIPALYFPVKMGTDVSTQVLPREILDFDMEVTPMVVNLIGRIIEQSLFETMEETKVDSLLLGERVYEETRRKELLRLSRLRIREQKVTQERQQQIARRQKELEEEKEIASVVTAALFSVQHLTCLTDHAFDELRHRGFMRGDEEFYKHIGPMLEERAMYRVRIKANSTALLDDIISAAAKAQ